MAKAKVTKTTTKTRVKTKGKGADYIQFLKGEKMANGINNKYEYRSGLLDSLNVQHTASDVRNEDEYRKKVLNGLGVEYTEDDINQKNLYRAKVVEGLASSGGGGGSSDFSTAEVTFENANGVGTFINIPYIFKTPTNKEFINTSYSPKIGTSVISTVLYKGLAFMVDQNQLVQSVSGSIESLGDGAYFISGNCTITIS